MTRDPREPAWLTGLTAQFSALHALQSNRGLFHRAPLGRVLQDLPADRPFKIEELMLQRGVCYAWTPECLAACRTAAATLGDEREVHWTSELLPNHRYGFFWLPGLLEVPNRPPGVAVHALAWGVAPGVNVKGVAGTVDTLVMSFIEGHIDRPPYVPTLCWAWPRPLSIASVTSELRRQIITPGDATNLDAVHAVARFFLAACLWLHQRVAVAAAHPIERHLRKRLVREHRLDAPPLVHVVELRRPERPDAPDDAPHDVAWSCRWMVGGHWHRYHTAAGLQRKWIWPYLKGPSDKPFRAPGLTVYQVDR